LTIYAHLSTLKGTVYTDKNRLKKWYLLISPYGDYKASVTDSLYSIFYKTLRLFKSLKSLNYNIRNSLEIPTALCVLLKLLLPLRGHRQPQESAKSRLESARQSSRRILGVK
jgi:hypothetical protein